MNSSFTIKQEIEVFEEEIVEHYPTPIKEEFMPLKCEKMKADEITIHTEPSRWLQEPLDIPTVSVCRRHATNLRYEKQEGITQEMVSETETQMPRVRLQSH